ncbi:MAG: SsrA-binding protein SmpB [Erysipelotrichales bacterium]|nr:SsrA-binding protein SmpB [Erysipelotrichales bacterium]MBQ1386260.1 SsrA-binding protein SmpB [Erysipelotrichales bacterium]MBQ4012238.1 SsrA-binding protein SmpB [Erysipelotrichales bacterium]MBQ4375527.1 SsrA-binding protein SmpB [Erysipelotrichales bacterium]
MPKENAGQKIIAVNRKARHDYFLEEFYEAGIELMGTEIKSIRKGQVNLRDSYIDIKQGEAYVVGMHISRYKEGNIFNHEETRDRRLLLHKKEIRKLDASVRIKGYTLVPTKIYLTRGICKMEIALAKGKDLHDKRESSKKKEALREIEKAEKNRF